MSRSGYVDDCENLAMWRGQVASATRGKRGQAFFRDLIEALDAMPEKRLIRSPHITITDEWGERPVDSLGSRDGNVCVLGALAKHRNLPVLEIDAGDCHKLGDTFDIAHQLAAESMFMNDEYFDTSSPETRWLKMREWAVKQLTKETVPS